MSTLMSFRSPDMTTGGAKSVVLSRFRYWTKALTPPSKWYSRLSPLRSSVTKMRTPAFRKASSMKRLLRVSREWWTSSKISLSGR